MSHWSKGAAQRFIDKRNAKQIQDAKVLHDQDMIELKAPEVWAQVRDCFERKCAEFNSELEVKNILSFNGVDPQKVKIIRNDTKAMMEATFIKRLYAIDLTGLGNPETFKSEVLPGTSDIGLFSSKDDRDTPENMTSAALDMFLAV